jgi:NAD(P)-dependent dehydrogenase (short-subunit alcohol dehydrogenase family)
VPRLRSGGSITFVTGGASVRPRVGTSIISAAFAALETLTKGLAIELAPLRVNTIRPGYTDSEMWSFLDDTARAELKKKVSAALPARRMGTVEDVGSAAIFLMSNPQITGSTLTIDGGETLVDGI